MKNMIFEINGTNYRRITKPVARRMFNSRKNVLLCACNLRPGAPWHPEIIVNSESGNTFNQVTNAFEYYNCNALSGYYAAFYIEA